MKFILKEALNNLSNEFIYKKGSSITFIRFILFNAYIEMRLSFLKTMYIK